ncbi:DUF3102 domain-containing protein [Nostoc sp. C057]|uniref:DUF3102 domain-containing protein n=1 Tax=Nostoc sp. C057 TaxID=2576903 RepID=UPI0015C3C166|nr:DUF3102 domain-containing protein [Nostoc sp. C057]QLE47961.1 DUF3102 domain-containing protein [Nostoc sp. C057]
MNLTELAININKDFERSKQLYQDGIEYLKLALLSDRQIGESLIIVKGALAYGEFKTWVEENCNFSRSHAYRLITIASKWDKIIAACPTRETTAELVLPSLRTAIALAAAEPKPELPPPEPTTKYKVALPSHPCYGETVEVKEELSKGDVILCKTSKGEIPFLKKELVPESQPLDPVDAEIIDVKVTDISEQLKEAIALVIEYLPENELKAVLAASLSIGKDYLPSDAQGMAAKLIGGKETAVLSQG